MRARLILGALLLVLVGSVLPSSNLPATSKPPAGRGDAVLHRDTVERIRKGEPYYAAVGAGLRQESYPSTKIFNWRTPAHFVLLGSLSPAAATLLLRLLIVTALLLAPLAFSRQPTGAILTLILALMGALATAANPEAIVFAEVWAGVLVAVSIAAYYCARSSLGACLALAALFVRELAAPYCVVCAALAVHGRRKSETTVWVVGGFAYVVYFAAHAYQVLEHQQPGDVAQAASWVRWNGLAFTLATVEVNGWLGFVPDWMTPLFTVVAISGAVARDVPRQVSLSVAAYLAAFAVAGQPFNYYWGFVTAPIWAYTVAHGPAGLSELVSSSRGAVPLSDATVALGRTAP